MVLMECSMVINHAHRRQAQNALFQPAPARYRLNMILRTPGHTELQRSSMAEDRAVAQEVDTIIAAPTLRPLATLQSHLPRQTARAGRTISTSRLEPVI